MIYNSLRVSELEVDQELYLIRYSHAGYPDFIIVRYVGYETDNHIKYMNSNGVHKKLNISKLKYRLFCNIDEMSRTLYDCFIKRRVELLDDYKKLFLDSQENRPELWIWFMRIMINKMKTMET